MNPAQPICNYALFRFLPYPETGEFVNLGVVVHCLQPGFMEFQMEDPKSARVMHFFPELNREKFEAAHAAITAEVVRVRNLVTHAHDPRSAQRAFQELVRPRESIFRFSEIRTIQSPDPTNLAKDLFDRYVRRVSFQQKEPQVNAKD
ncbi:MAG: DUF3037 domain-containing protein [Verrucomicrobiota bacterium]